MQRSEYGFTLLEVLVALVITALATGGLLAAAGGGLQSARRAAQTELMLSHARSHLAAIGAGGVIASGAQSGDDGGGLRWRALILQLAVSPLPGAPAGSKTQAVLYSVTVTVASDGDGEHGAVTLQTERMGLAAAGPP